MVRLGCRNIKPAVRCFGNVFVPFMMDNRYPRVIDGEAIRLYAALIWTVIDDDDDLNREFVII